MKKIICYLFFIIIFELGIYIKCERLLYIKFIKTNISTFPQCLTENEIYTNFNFGTPYQKIPVFFKFNQYLSIISNKNIGGFYNFEKSKSIKFYNKEETTFIYNTDLIYGKIAKENIELKFRENFYSNDGFKKDNFNNFTFLFCNNIENTKNNEINRKKNIIGLHLRQINTIRDENFLNQLYENNIIQSYSMFLDYNKSELIIGITNLKYFDYISYKNPFNEFNIIFDVVKYQSKNDKILNDFGAEVILNFDFNGIYSPKSFYKIINKYFFNEYISKGICSINNYELKPEIMYIKCQSGKLNYQNFPNISFYSQSLNKTFELNAEDLFITYNDTLYFLIYSKTYLTQWIFGYPFFKKYNILINPEKKIIGFPNKNFIVERETEKKKDILIFILIIIIIILSYFFVKALIKINKLIKKRRKKNANELEDNYTYFSSSSNNEYYHKI